MKVIDVINLVRRANFSSKDYRLRIDKDVSSQGLTERFSVQIYIGHLARLGMGTQVLDVTYMIDLRTKELTINYIDTFREGNWIKALEKEAERGDARKAKARARFEEEERIRKSPIKDERLFRVQ